MSNKKLIIFVVLAGVLGLALYAGFTYISSLKLPILSEKVKKVNGEKGFKEITEVEGYDHNGNSFNTKQLKGKVHVAAFFFASCPVVCPKMTKETKRVRDYFKDRKEDLNFVSYTIDTERDSIPKLYNFAEKFDLANSNWYFVNLGKINVYKLAKNDYKIATIHGNKSGSDFVHSELLTLVDEDLLIRGYYDSTNPEELEQLTKDIKKLLK